MKKSKYVVLGLLVFATVLFISGTMIGGFSELKTLYSNGNFSFIGTRDVTREFTDIKNLEIQAEAGEIEFIEYDGAVIKVEAKNVSKNIKLLQENDTLVVKDSFRFWHLVNIGNVSTNIKIYVPANYEFDRVELEVDAGRMEIANLTAQEVEIEVDAGDFIAKKITSSYTKVDVDVGNAQIDLLNSDKSKFGCDVGNIEITMSGSEAEYSYEADVDAGDIMIGSYQSEGISDQYRHHGGRREIEADCDVGSIKVRMEV